MSLLQSMACKVVYVKLFRDNKFLVYQQNIFLCCPDIMIQIIRKPKILLGCYTKSEQTLQNSL